VAAAKKPRYVDVANPDLAVDCPRCGLKTARFVDHCRNCGYKLWPSSHMASAAFLAWRAADPARPTASRFDLEIPTHVDNTVDFSARAHELGIHLFPRIVLAVIGGVIFLYGVVGWVLIEDVRMYPGEGSETGTEVHH